MAVRTRLLLAFGLMGLTFAISQTLMIRELLVAFSGVEVILGVVLGVWLLLEALGSATAARWLAGRAPRAAWFAALQLALAVLLPLSLVLARSVRAWLGALPGVALGLGDTFRGTCGALLPLGLVDGAMFATAAAVYVRLTRRDAAGVVYAAEAIGGIAGGALLTFLLLPRLNTSAIILLLLAGNALSAAALLWSPSVAWRERLLLGVAGAAFLLSALAGIYPGVERLDRRLEAARWPGQTLLASANSPYAHLAITAQEEQRTFWLDGLPVVTSPVPDLAEAEVLAHLPLLYVAQPRRALVIGGGAGGVLRELLKYPELRVDYVELDPVLLRLLREHAPLAAAELADPRVRVHAVDGRRYLRQPPADAAAPDLILLDLPSPTTLLLNRYYTVGAFQQAQRLLAAGGVLAITLPGNPDYLSAELRDLNALLERTLRAVFPQVQVIVGERNLWLASSTAPLRDVPLATLQARWAARAIPAHIINPAYIALRLDPGVQDGFWRALAESDGAAEINTDLRPVGVGYALRHWHALVSSGWARLARSAGRANLGNVGAPLVALLWLWAAVAWRRGGASAPVGVVAITGLSGMVIDLTLILALQSLLGYAYQQVGLVVAAFMGGLALGASIMTASLRPARPDLARRLIWLVAALGAYAIGLAGALRALYVATLAEAWTLGALLALNALGGALVGALFPLANALLVARGAAPERAAGQLYAADLAGAFLGALLGAALFLPGLGAWGTCWLLALLQLGSLALALAARD